MNVSMFFLENELCIFFFCGLRVWVKVLPYEISHIISMPFEIPKSISGYTKESQVQIWDTVYTPLRSANLSAVRPMLRECA